jgi:hypothetical protein
MPSLHAAPKTNIQRPGINIRNLATAVPFHDDTTGPASTAGTFEETVFVSHGNCVV